MSNQAGSKRLIVAGAGGHGKVIADIAEKTGKYTHIAFLDDNTSKKTVLGYPIIGTMNFSDFQRETDEIIVAVGDAQVRKRLQEQYESMGLKIATLKHPAAVIGTNVSIGSGTVIMAGAVINCDTVIGKGNIINTCASVDHECRIEEFVHISVDAHLCGNVHVGKECWIGAGSVVINNKDICDNCMIGAGAVVVNHIQVSGIYVGVPAKVMKDRDGE